jgi:hypothetical protein
VAGGATVYAGAVMGGTASVGGGYSGGVVSVSIDIGLQLGIGVDLKLDFGVNVGAAGSVFSSLVNTSGPGMSDRQASADLHGLELKKDPAARFAYLSSNSEWNYMGKSSAENSAFLRDYVNLLTATQRMYDDQKNWQATFLQLLKTDPARAVEYSRTKPDFRQQQIEVLRTATRLGVTLKVVDGAVKYVSSGGL